MGFSACFVPRVSSVGHFSAEDLFGPGQSRRERPVRNIPDDHQIQVAAGIPLPLRERTVDKGELDPPEMTESIEENGVSRRRSHNQALEIFIQWMFSIQGVTHLIPDAFRVQEPYGSKPAEVPEQVPCRLGKNPSKLPDMECSRVE